MPVRGDSLAGFQSGNLLCSSWWYFWQMARGYVWGFQTLTFTEANVTQVLRTSSSWVMCAITHSNDNPFTSFHEKLNHSRPMVTVHATQELWGYKAESPLDSLLPHLPVPSLPIHGPSCPSSSTERPYLWFESWVPQRLPSFLQRAQRQVSHRKNPTTND